MWHERIEASDEVDEVLAVTRDYLATLHPEHLARLPADCRPGCIKGEDDIAYWSCQLAQSHHREPTIRIDASLMEELLTYFLHAWVRVSQLQREVIAPDRLH